MANGGSARLSHLPKATGLGRQWGQALSWLTQAPAQMTAQGALVPGMVGCRPLSLPMWCVAYTL